MKKNCYNCRYLEYYEADFEEMCDSGYCCNGRDYKYESQEYKHLRKLQNRDYLNRAKKCCVLYSAEEIAEFKEYIGW